MHSQIYRELSLIFAILRNFSVTGAKVCTKRYSCARSENVVFFYLIGQKKSLEDLFLGRTTTKIVHRTNIEIY